MQTHSLSVQRVIWAEPDRFFWAASPRQSQRELIVQSKSCALTSFRFPSEMIGRQLLNYEILEKLGAGGHGEVYRALDTRLNRPVVIKVLPHELTDNERNLELIRRSANTRYPQHGRALHDQQMRGPS